MEVIVPSTQLFAASAGHDRYAKLIEECLIADGNLVFNLPLRPERTTSRREAMAWNSVERGKAKLTEAYRSNKSNAYLTFAGAFLEAFTSPLRRSKFFQESLTESYRKMASRYPGVPVVSSHYLGLLVDDRNTTYLTPDITLHKAATDIIKEKKSKLIIPQKPTKNDLLMNDWNLNSNIIQKELPVTWEMFLNTQRRLERQRKLDDGKEKTHNILVTLGASGAEFPEIGNIVSSILKQSSDKDGKQYNLTVNCGNITHRYNADLYNYLRLFSHDYSDKLKLTTSKSRYEDLHGWYEQLNDPMLDTLVTRPNEMLTIGPALGFRTLLTKPFQHHEVYSARRITSGTNTNVMPFDWCFDHNGCFDGFQTDDIAGNYAKDDFWCKAGVGISL